MEKSRSVEVAREDDLQLLLSDMSLAFQPFDVAAKVKSAPRFGISAKINPLLYVFGHRSHPSITAMNCTCYILALVRSNSIGKLPTS